MLRIVVRVLINALALWAAAWLLPGITLTETSGGSTGNTTVDLVLAYLFIGVVFGIVNALVRPVVRLLSLPLTVLTLGLFTVIINAGMLMLTAWLSQHTPVHFDVDSFFWTAVLGALIISVVSLIAGTLTGTRK